MDPLLILDYIYIKRLNLCLALCAFIYLLVARILRYRRARSLEREYAPEGRKSFSNMTANDAQAILKILAELEFPTLYGFSMVVALFRVSDTKPAVPNRYILTGTSRHTASQAYLPS